MERYTTAEVKAGIAVAVSVILLVASVATLGDFKRTFAGKRVVHMCFEDCEGLGPNETVRYAGVLAGKVTDVGIITVEELKRKYPSRNWDIEGQDGKPPRELSLLTVELEKAFAPRVDDKVKVDRTLTGMLSVEVMPNGTGEAWTAEYGPLLGISYVGWEHYANQAEKFLAESQENINQLVKDARTAVGNVNDILDKTEQRIDEIPPGRLNEILDKVNQTAEETRKAAAEVGDIISENRQTVKDSVTAGKETIEKTKELVGTAGETLQKAQDELVPGLENFKALSARMVELTGRLDGLLGKVGGVVDYNQEDIRKTVADLAATADNLKQVSEEARRQPWILLNKPTDEESRAREMAYAARQMDQSAKMLEEAVERLRRASPQGGTEPDELRKLSAAIKAQIEQLRARQSELEKKLRDMKD
ncbi:MAG TPA: hypothetical protein PL033_10190 [Candidatus Brocadiia bacterium]|nr:hypothetical protein [Candidatus Brocadiia bacterium]